MLEFIRRAESRDREVCNLYRCSCGIEKIIRRANVEKGRTKSCGCSRSLCPIRFVRSGVKTREYTIYKHIKQRCLNPKNKAYHNYGGRGITVCDQWVNSFENFFKDMGKSPSNKHEIDRIDNNKGYSPDNCRWATKIENAQNTRGNVNITWNGETKCRSQWARDLGLSVRKVNNRVLTCGWSDLEALELVPR